MTPYERGYTDTMEKIARGMFPSIKQLFQMGVKPGSGVSLLPYARGASGGAAQAATSVGKNMGLRGDAATSVGKRMLGKGRQTLTPEQMTGDTLRMARPSFASSSPPRMMPDVRDILRQRAQQAGTFSGL